MTRARAPRLAAGAVVLAIAWTGTACASAGSSSPAVTLTDRAFAGQRTGGVVLVARGKRLLLRRAYGLADLSRRTAMRPDHVLGTGSITKQFTAAAILRLVAAGRMALDADIRQYVPEALTDDRLVTIDQLLTHTSGMPNAVDRQDFDEVARREHTVDELLAMTASMSFLFEPGKSFHYSDSGYFLLGAAIERVTRQPLGHHLETELFRPLGMMDTWFVDGTRPIPRLATGYSMRAGDVVPPAFMNPTVPYAAGGVYSTADDLWAWIRAVRSGRVFPRDLLARAWASRLLPDGSVSGYGYGWKSCTIAGRPTVEHGGFVNGFLATLLYLPADDLTIIVLVNNDGDVPDPGVIARRLARLQVTGSADLPAMLLSPEQQESLVGRYQAADGQFREIALDHGSLVEIRDGTRSTLVPLSATRFTRPDSDESAMLDVDLDASGRAWRLRFSRRCEPGIVANRVN